MNQRDNLKEQKKRLQNYLDSKNDAMFVGSYSEGDLCFITSTMWKVSPTGHLMEIPPSTNWHYSPSSRGTLSNFYSYVRHIITLLSGGRR